MTKINTARLIIRELRQTDAESLFGIRSDACVNRYIDRRPPAGIDKVQEFIQQRNGDIESGKCYYWAITLKEKDELIGTICLWNFSEDKGIAEVGYELSPVYQGEGLMDEALKAVISFAFSSGFQLLEAVTHKMNFSSIRLLENNGFQYSRKFNEHPAFVIYNLKH